MHTYWLLGGCEYADVSGGQTCHFLMQRPLVVWTILKHRPPSVDIFCHTNRSANSMAMITVDELTENALDMTILTLFYERRMQQSTIIYYTSSWFVCYIGGRPSVIWLCYIGRRSSVIISCELWVVSRGPLLLGMTLSLISICSNCWFRFSFFTNCFNFSFVSPFPDRFLLNLVSTAFIAPCVNIFLVHRCLDVLATASFSSLIFLFIIQSCSSLMVLLHKLFTKVH